MNDKCSKIGCKFPSTNACECQNPPLLFCSVHSHLNYHGANGHKTIFLQLEVPLEIQSKIIEKCKHKIRLLEETMKNLIKDVQDIINQIKIQLINQIKSVEEKKKPCKEMILCCIQTEYISNIKDLNQNESIIKSFISGIDSFPNS